MFIVNSGMNQYAGPFKGASALLCHGFGINCKSRFDIVDRFIVNDFATRKIRSDKCETVFSSEQKRKQTFTPLHAYKKMRNREFRETFERIPGATLKAEYNQLTNNQKNIYEIMAQQNIARSRTIWDELKNFLLTTKGKVP